MCMFCGDPNCKGEFSVEAFSLQNGELTPLLSKQSLSNNELENFFNQILGAKTTNINQLRTEIAKSIALAEDPIKTLILEKERAIRISEQIASEEDFSLQQTNAFVGVVTAQYNLFIEVLQLLKDKQIALSEQTSFSN